MTVPAHDHDIYEAQHITLAPKLFRGVAVPDTLRPNWDQPEAYFWRMGVVAALGAIDLDMDQSS